MWCWQPVCDPQRRPCVCVCELRSCVRRLWVLAHDPKPFVKCVAFIDHAQIAAAAGAAEVVALFVTSDATLAGLTKSTTGNTLLHYAALGPPHVADIYKAGAAVL